MQVNQDMIRESVREQIKFQMNEGQKEAVMEGMFQRLMAKGTDKFQFMFLVNEAQDTRYLMSKDNQGNMHWHMFIGRRHMESGKFMNDSELYAFVDEKNDEGFKTVNKQGGIAKFIKAVGRGLGFLITFQGITTALGAFIMIALAVVDPTIISGIFGPQSVGMVTGLYGGAAAVGIVAAGAGWVTAKVSKKQFVPDTPDAIDSDEDSPQPAAV